MRDSAQEGRHGANRGGVRGSGEGLGGLRALAFYHQRAAVQGSRPVIEALVAGAVSLAMA